MKTPRPTASNEAGLVAHAKAGDPGALEAITEPYRKELQVHCYRMLGSFHDAEDLVQETFLRACRGVERFEGRASVRTWLYRIATNACLNVIESRGRARRVLPEMHGPPSTAMPGAVPGADVAWLEPYPDAALEGIPDGSPGPDARYEMREAVQLAFIAAIQLLPPRQRAALLLHDVLGWTAAESARVLKSSSAAINSALQRARATVEQRRVGGASHATLPPNDSQRTLLARYLRAWESADVDGFVSLLREDAVFSMPPWPQWYRGRNAIAKFFLWTARPGGHGPFRLLATAANRQPAFGFYGRWQGLGWRPHSIQLLTIDGDAIAAMTSFVTPALFRDFHLPAELPA